jgi:hypothetical protein
MEAPFKATGGAQLGWINSSWPLARLSVTREKLILAVTLMGTYSFNPSDVAAVELYVLFPLLAWGVRVRHCKTDYPQRIIFWSLGHLQRILDGILGTGFLPTASAATAVTHKGMPMRWRFVAVAILLWNVIFIVGTALAKQFPSDSGFFVVATLFVVFALCICLLNSTGLQRLALKPGHAVGEIKPFLRLLAFITGLLLVVFSILWATGAL